MHFPFLVENPFSGVQDTLTASSLAELSLAPKEERWAPGPVILQNPNPVWQASLNTAPTETISTIVYALDDLIMATTDLEPPTTKGLDDCRAKRHLDALISLWLQCEGKLPEGLSCVRHVLQLPDGRFLNPLPVVEGSLDPFAPACIKSLYKRLKSEFGSVEIHQTPISKGTGTLLTSIQAGLSQKDVATAGKDDSISVFGLRDPAYCAEFAAAQARSWIEQGTSARDIAVVVGDSGEEIARAFAKQGVPVSGLPKTLPERDMVGEAALNLVLSKRPQTSPMVFASLVLSPLMPWSAQTGRDLAEDLMNGDFRGISLLDQHDFSALWEDLKAPASSLSQLNFLVDRVCVQIRQGDKVRDRISIPPGDGSPEFDDIVRSIQVHPPSTSESDRNLEGVSLWSAYKTSWRSCKRLIITDFAEGLYPVRPRPNPLFLNSEIALIREQLGLDLNGISENLSRNLALFEDQMANVADHICFLVPRRELSGARCQPSVGLSMIARFVEGVDLAGELIQEVSSLRREDWPIPFYLPKAVPSAIQGEKELKFPNVNLLELRKSEDNQAKPQSPSRLDNLIISPLAWILNELEIEDMSWEAESLNALMKGNIAHYVFEHAFPADNPLLSEDDLAEAVKPLFDKAITRYARFLRNPAWELERYGLEREIRGAALLWRRYLIDAGARILGNEVWLAGTAHGIRMHGKADTILEMPEGNLIIVDHKKSSTHGRRKRMEKHWDLQVGLYRDMLANPVRSEKDEMQPLIGKPVSIAYHLMNDGGVLTSGKPLEKIPTAIELGTGVNGQALQKLKERIHELKNGRIVLNKTTDEKFFRTQAGLTPYALIDGSILIRKFMIEEDVA